MKEYHKIQSIFKRNEKNGKFILGEWTLPEFDYLKHNQWSFTEKVDGTNIRIIWDGEKLRFAGKTDAASIPTFLFAKLQDKFNAEQFKSIFNNPICLYGEGYGAKIQKGGGNYIHNGVDFVLFDVRVGEFWLERHNVKEIAEKLNLSVVPEIGQGTIFDAIEQVRNGFKSTWGNFLAEGLVLRPVAELESRNNQRIITKIKHRDFEL